MSDQRRFASRRRLLRACGIAGVAGIAGCTDDEDDGDGDRDDRRDRRSREEDEEDDDGGFEEGNGDTNDDEESEAESEDGLEPGETDLRLVASDPYLDDPAEAVYSPLVDHVESETGVRIEVVEAASDAAAMEAIDRGNAELADVGPGTALDGREKLDIVGIREAFGSAWFFSTVTTTFESDVESLGYLVGETVSLGHVLSVSGTLVPLTMLAERGIDVGTAPAGSSEDFEALYTDHRTAREVMVHDDTIAAAATGAFSSAPYIGREQFDELSQDFADLSADYGDAGSDIGGEHGEIQLLAVSDPIPRAPIVARADWTGESRELVEAALREAPPSAFTQDAGSDVEGLWFSGLVSGTFADFDPFVRVFDSLDIEPEDL